MSDRTPSVFVVGAGPAGSALAGALSEAGIGVLGLWGRTPSKVTEAARLADVPGFSDAEPPRPLLRSAEVIVLAVRDAAISEVAEGLLASGHLDGAPTLLHCSGAISAELAFAGVADQVAGMGLLHPLRALAPGVPVRSLQGTTFGVQGDTRGRSAAAALCEALGGRMLALEASQMAGYHAAAAIASNYLVALMDVATGLMKAEGLEAGPAAAGLLDLAAGALQNVEKRGLPEALTGPIRRGDGQTVDRHLQAVHKSLPEASALYSALGLWTARLAGQCGDATEEELQVITDLLTRDG